MVDVSVIGCGNMGGALVRGLAAAGYKDLTVYDVDPAAFDRVGSLAVETTTDVDIAGDAELLFLAVKPDLVTRVLDEFELSPEQTVISIAAGVDTDTVRRHTDAGVVRLMPNLAAEWGSMAGAVTGDVEPPILALLRDIGAVVEVEEELMDTATAVNGSGPAFVIYLIRALVESGVERGLAPDDARILAAQTFQGAAETVLRADESIDELIDAVCSPNGTTVEGMAVLRESDIQETIADAVIAAEKRATELAVEAHE